MKKYSCFLACLMFLIGARASDPKGVAEGNNLFALKLFHELKSGTQDNLFFSPFSISTALAMTYAGARGETALQMMKTLCFSQTEQFHSDYKELVTEITGNAENKIKLNIANGLWANKDFKFLNSYFTLVRSNYFSELKNVDFNSKEATERTRKDINLWVEQKTNNKIKDLLQPVDLPPMTELVLVNAIYFYADWAHPFEKSSTDPGDFHKVDGTILKVPFMHKLSGIQYFEDDKIKAVEIPYKDDKASFMIILPNSFNGIIEFGKIFDYQYYQKVISGMHSTSVRLSFPKFQSTFKISLKPTLSELGMPLAFSSGGADFSGMTGKKNLSISDVIHQAFINVDEAGTEAAAATAVVMKGALAPAPPRNVKIFRADHPFIFCIIDNASGSILFMGTMMDPPVSK